MTDATTRNAAGRGALLAWLALFVVVMGLAVAKKTGLVDNDTAKRGVAISLGAMLVVAGNLLPKFRLFDAPDRDPALVLSAERTAGWTLLLAGVAYVGVWLFAPMDLALPVSSAVGLAAFASAGWLWLRLARSRLWPAGAARAPLAESALVKRTFLLVILGSVLWTVAIFLVDYLWGDNAAQWAAVWYPVGLGLLLAATSWRRLLPGDGSDGVRS